MLPVDQLSLVRIWPKLARTPSHRPDDSLRCGMSRRTTSQEGERAAVRDKSLGVIFPSTTQFAPPVHGSTHFPSVRSTSPRGRLPVAVVPFVETVPV